MRWPSTLCAFCTRSNHAIYRTGATWAPRGHCSSPLRAHLAPRGHCSSPLRAHLAPRGHCSSPLRAPIGASRPLFEPTSSPLSVSNALFEPTSRPLGASKALFEPASCSSVLQGHLAPRKHVRIYCSKNAWHCSAPLRAALLCSTLLRAWICTGSH